MNRSSEGVSAGSKFLWCLALCCPVLTALSSEHGVSPFQGESYFHNKWRRAGGAESNIGFVRKGQIRSEQYTQGKRDLMLDVLQKLCLNDQHCFEQHSTLATVRPTFCRTLAGFQTVSPFPHFLLQFSLQVKGTHQKVNRLYNIQEHFIFPVFYPF